MLKLLLKLLLVVLLLLLLLLLLVLEVLESRSKAVEQSEGLVTLSQLPAHVFALQPPLGGHSPQPFPAPPAQQQQAAAPWTR